MRGDSLKPQDVLVACKLFAQEKLRVEPTYALLSEDLGISLSTSHDSVERCRRALLLPVSGWSVSSRHLRDLLVVAVPRVYYVVRAGVMAGMPTSVHAAVLAGKIKSPPGSMPVVWREDVVPEGLPRGEAIEPLYPSVPAACRADNVLYELLALADVMRVGTTSERTAAADLLDRRLFAK